MCFTQGTSGGLPRCVLLSHDGVTFQAGAAAALSSSSESDRQLSAIPNANAAGLFAHVSLSMRALQIDILI